MRRNYRTWEDYFYPGTEVLRNKRDIRSLDKLRDFEESSARLRMAQMLVNDPVDGDFDRAHMRAIHRRIFGDVYEWAGDERTAPPWPQQMSKGGPSPEAIQAGDYTAPDRYPYRYFPAGDAMDEHFDRWAAPFVRESQRRFIYRVRGGHRRALGRDERCPPIP